jgi:pimeloyl-ACP methyl ester carboxylesterase
MHGWGTYRDGPHEMLAKMARALAATGLAVLRFDFRGRGESPGDYLATDLDSMIDDAVAASSFLRSEARVGEVVGVGLCSGANVALAATAWGRAYDRAACLSVLPFQSHVSAMQPVRRMGGRIRSLLLKALNPWTWLRLVTGRVRVWRVLRNVFARERRVVATASGGTRNPKDSQRDLVGALLKCQRSLLFIWGGADAEGTGARRHFEDLARRGSLQAEFRVVEGANHNFYSLEWERKAIAAVREFALRS